MEKVNILLEKYNNFKYEQIRSVEHHEDGSKTVTIAVMDDDGEDTNIVNLTFSNINDVKLLVNDVLSYLDMTSGITLVKENGLYGFAIGNAAAMHYVHNAPLYIIASDLKIEDIAL